MVATPPVRDTLLVLAAELRLGALAVAVLTHGRPLVRVVAAVVGEVTQPPPEGGVRPGVK